MILCTYISDLAEWYIYLQKYIYKNIPTTGLINYITKEDWLNKQLILKIYKKYIINSNFEKASKNY